MKIAVTSQNRKTVTEHAGKCRKFWIYDIEGGAVSGKTLVELPIEQSFHASRHELADELSGVEVLITASMGAGLHQHLIQSGIRPLITTEEDPDIAVTDYLAGRLARMPVERDTACRHGHQH